MASRLSEVLIDFFSEDPQAWDGLPFMTEQDPFEVGRMFVDYLSDALDDMKVSSDPLDHKGLLGEILKSNMLAPNTLTMIGNGIMQERGLTSVLARKG